LNRPAILCKEQGEAPFTLNKRRPRARVHACPLFARESHSSPWYLFVASLLRSQSPLPIATLPSLFHRRRAGWCVLPEGAYQSLQPAVRARGVKAPFLVSSVAAGCPIRRTPRKPCEAPRLDGLLFEALFELKREATDHRPGSLSGPDLAPAYQNTLHLHSSMPPGQAFQLRRPLPKAPSTGLGEIGLCQCGGRRGWPFWVWAKSAVMRRPPAQRPFGNVSSPPLTPSALLMSAGAWGYGRPSVANWNAGTRPAAHGICRQIGHANRPRPSDTVYSAAAHAWPAQQAHAGITTTARGFQGFPACCLATLVLSSCVPQLCGGPTCIDYLLDSLQFPGRPEVCPHRLIQRKTANASFSAKPSLTIGTRHLNDCLHPEQDKLLHDQALARPAARASPAGRSRHTKYCSSWLESGIQFT